VKQAMTEPPDKKAGDVAEQDIRHRPLWQRIVYPVLGLILVILGIIGWVVPIVMGFPLIIIGIPLLFCFHPRLEWRVRGYLRSIGQSIMKCIRRKTTGCQR